MIDTKTFVENELNAAITKAKLHIDHLEYDPEHKRFGEAVVLVCKDGYRYEQNVSGNSLLAIIEDVTKAALFCV